MKNKMFSIIFILIGSILPDIIMNSYGGIVPTWFLYGKIALLTGCYILTIILKDLVKLSNLVLILITINASQLFTDYIKAAAFWKSSFNLNLFSENIGSSILLKMIGIVPVIAVLFLLLKKPGEFYLVKGDLSEKADKISWLGIEHKTIKWIKLSVISGFLIAFGTILLTLITTTGFKIPSGINKLWYYLPVILLFALINSFCEGVLFRNAILGTLKNAIPKALLPIMAALFFGIAHYYGVPGGMLGGIMSGLLGWYMSRSMVETRGFVSAWIIHFMQDVVIFSTLLILGSFR